MLTPENERWVVDAVRAYVSANPYDSSVIAFRRAMADLRATALTLGWPDREVS